MCIMSYERELNCQINQNIYSMKSIDIIEHLCQKKKKTKRRVVIYPRLIQGALIIQNKIAIDIK